MNTVQTQTENNTKTTTPSKTSDKTSDKTSSKPKASKTSTRGARGAAKAAKAVAKAKGEKKSKKRTPVEKDIYGLRVGSKQSIAAAMYGSKTGATTDEIRAKLNNPHLNVLTDVQGRGFEKVVKMEPNKEGRQVKRYFIKKASQKTAKKAA